MSVMDCKEGVKHKINDSRNVRTLEEQGFDWMLPSAKNTACVDISRLTVVHRGRPGGHSNLHMSLYRSFIQWFLSKGSKQIVIKADRTGPLIHLEAQREKSQW